jgi:outer membrane lipoprotein-sorting protein
MGVHSFLLLLLLFCSRTAETGAVAEKMVGGMADIQTGSDSD